MLSIRRILTAATLTCAAAVAPVAALTAPAMASRSQVALFQEDGRLASDPQGTMDTLRGLGAQEVRVYVEWSSVAPDAGSFTRPGGNLASSSAYNWARYDRIVAAARRDHMKLDFILSGGAPHWAISKGFPTNGDNIHFAWKPDPTLWGDFVHAAVSRFSGSVKAWEIYNEPNFGEDLAPQKSGRYDLGASQYRTLLGVAWKQFAALHQTHAQITIAQVTARGQAGGGLPGDYGQTKPLIFLRDLYCVDTKFRQLSGSAAKYAGCPTTSSARRRFASANPALFHSSGLGIHPYAVNLPPTTDSSRDPNFVTFNKIPTLEKVLDGIAKTYHAHRGTALYNNEYGYVTSPPGAAHKFAGDAQAAGYMNQAEYLSYKDPRLRTYMQYLLVDPPTNGPSQFFSGLQYSDGRLKATYYAYRMPLWIPNSRVKKGQATEVWGAARPAATVGGHAKVSILWQKNSRSPAVTVATVTPGRGNGYFDVKVKFPGSGLVATAWSDPTAGVIYSRLASITVR